MRPWPLLILAIGIAGAFAPVSKKDEPYVLLLGGNMDGYLSPCGCTKPMAGGIKRRVSAIRLNTRPERTIVLENGGIVSHAGRQDELKAETAAEILKAAGVTAINLSGSDAALGRGMLLSLSGLSDDRLVSTSVSGAGEVQQYHAHGPFLIGGTTTNSEALRRTFGGAILSPKEAAARLASEAASLGLKPILLLDGSRTDAAQLARDIPALALIQYRATGDPPANFEKVGETVLITPGEKGKHLVRLSFDGGIFGGYLPIKLLPNFKDDATAARLYKTYLNRVSSEKLLEKVPRRDTALFAGNATCGSCHKAAMAVWKKSQHSHALKTLEVEGHDRDPDCVGCHVVGLDSKQGFKSRSLTPSLTDVGCESCHGPGKSHAISPKKVKMGKVGSKTCLPCHTSATSPGFDFKAYWKKVQHK